MISFSQVTKHYAGRPVVEGISLSIARGAFVALVGQSGAGKTTLLKAINRLVEIDSGAITIDGEDVTALPLAALRRRTGYVFQGIGLFPHMSVAENIWLVPRLQGVPIDGRAERVARLLELVALPPVLADRYPAQLSGGQAQRVGFARALAAEPSLMLMDEPFGALDPVTRSELGRAYRALHERMGLTSLLVTHDMAEALLLADRIIVLGEGHILADLPPRELLAYRGHANVQAMIDVVRDQTDRLDALGRSDG
ncbi:ATP-binding cassette domain-containing protein [Sphingobium nicotianae]|uniref:ABC transporter ATP-binding protein n=1 Tax=Sphingobium nicotianae TaxID=2782607 RepID=A0A9X1DFR9_9SPHN|nr:ABC transporter ATP-binding protein [Sphingobium nicotianae]MBT2189023.1 ABC transporter ATP-binding protein [Sphingobium nicotianae]